MNVSYISKNRIICSSETGWLGIDRAGIDWHVVNGDGDVLASLPLDAALAFANRKLTAPAKK